MAMENIFDQFDWSDMNEVEVGGSGGEPPGKPPRPTADDSKPEFPDMSPATDSSSPALAREDSYTADFLHYEFGQNVKYDHVRMKWFVWHKGQHHWRLDDHEETLHMAETAARHRIKALVDARAGESALKVAVSLLNDAPRERALKVLRTRPDIAVGQEHWDMDPDVLCVRNGVVDLRSGVLRPGRRDDAITKHSPVIHDSTAVCPRWDKFLLEVFVDPALIDYVQRVVGYCLTGLTTEQAWFLLYGTGGNGKSVFADVLAALLGAYHEQAAMETFIATRWGPSAGHNIVQLRGARLAVASEVPEKATFDAPRIKALTGGDLVTAAAKYENNTTFRPQFKLMLLVNHLPSVNDDSPAFWRRIRTIPFTQTFSPPDAGLLNVLRSELPGILNWCLEGARNWYASGLGVEPSSASQLRTDYQKESDPLGLFINDCVLETGDAADAVAAREVFRIYEDWCHQTKRQPMNETNFGRSSAMSGLGLGRKRTNSGTFYHGVQVFELGNHPVVLPSDKM